MENNKILEKTREAIEEHIQLIIRKTSNMTPMDIDILTKDICALEALKRIEDCEPYDEYDNSNSYRRSYNSGRYTSRNAYHSGDNSSRSYDGNSNDKGYSGHSIQDRMVDKLERMMDETQSENERKTVREWINRLRSS